MSMMWSLRRALGAVFFRVEEDVGSPSRRNTSGVVLGVSVGKPTKTTGVIPASPKPVGKLHCGPMKRANAAPGLTATAVEVRHG